MIGIENVNEFYTNHYLAAIVGGDVRPQLDRWRDDAKQDEGSTPWRRLAQLQQDFFRFKDQLERQRNAATRVEAHRTIAAALLGALGYELTPVHRELSVGPLPLLGTWARPDGEPLLWLLAAPSAHGREEDLLARTLLPEQHELVTRPGSGPESEPQLDKPELRALHKRRVEELVTDAFGLEDAPRFVIIVGDTQWVLADRSKWAEQRMLRFDWVELLGRRETEVLELVTALLHRESLAPESGSSLVDTLDDSSHKHAYEVSEDLKSALRESIERIGNEAIRYRRDVSKKKVFGEEIDGQELAIQCIRYMYRILFLLYIEARPELGYAPMGSDAYRLGYSFERLRELEMLELDTPEAREGHYIHACLDRLFQMVYEGTDTQAQQALLMGAGSPRTEGESVHHAFKMVPLRSHLFDPGRTPFLKFGFVRLRNEVLLEVIRAMSLSAPQGKGKHKRRGRISYATLGINQLGAVYEALLSFRGFFAEETLYEVKPAKVKEPNPVQDPAYFVPEADLGQYKKNERVYDGDGELRSYAPGSFIYRMAGRDRQKSASYYTPEVLTKCLVKYALKELLENDDGSPKFAKAEDLLELTICEPAMGSAAFLNEAINQLAERYLQRRQQELGERIPHDRYLKELQRVRMFIADNNVYGVDLNPIAIELAEVSLWLNAIFTDQTEQGTEVFVPWFGGQLACGNSLVGAWRKVFSAAQLRSKKGAGWLDAVPERIMLGTDRPKGSVYHFLLPDRGMAVYGQGNEGKPIRELCTDDLAKIDVWRVKMCAPLSKEDIAALVRLSDAIDKLWGKHIELFRKVRERTTDPLSVYGHEHPLAGRRATTTQEKDRIWSKEMASEQVRASSPYRRLKLAMDYWCALWFWPIQQAEMLPDRDEWLADLALFLDSDVLPDLKGGGDQRELFADTMPAEEAREQLDEVGFADVERLIERSQRLALADYAARTYHFYHWDLNNSEVMLARGGFDLVLGNPPWVKLEWKEDDVLGEWLPSIIIHPKEAQHDDALRQTIGDKERRRDFLLEFEQVEGNKGALSSATAYAELSHLPVNLYRNFIVLSWKLLRPGGRSGLLHPENVFESGQFGSFRREVYPRVRFHLQFQNALKLFPVAHRKRFGMTVYGEPQEPRFAAMFNLFHPSTVYESESTSAVFVPGIKTEDDKWDLSGHASRRIWVDKQELLLFQMLYGDSGDSPLETPLPRLHSTQLRPLLVSAAAAPLRAGDLAGFFSDLCWHERNARVDKTIRSEVAFVKRSLDLVIKGPHFNVGLPFAKTPRRGAAGKSEYDVVDLQSLPTDYLPRTMFLPVPSDESYRARARTVRTSAGVETCCLDHYRVVVSRQLSLDGERTLQPAIIPPGVSHIHSVFGCGAESLEDVVDIAATWSSMPLDFLVRLSGAGDMSASLARRLPVANRWGAFGRVRALRLNALTSLYSAIWSELFQASWCDDDWLGGQGAADVSPYSALTDVWTADVPIRSALMRRRALLELDVWSSSSLGLSLKDLRSIYRVQFPVLRSYERHTWYDAKGNVVHTKNKGLPGVGLPRCKTKEHANGPYWEDVKHMSEEAGYTGTTPITQTVIDDTLPGGPREKTITYHPPWVRCDRERDYEIAWDHFARRFGLEGHS